MHTKLILYFKGRKKNLLILRKSRTILLFFFNYLGDCLKLIVVLYSHFLLKFHSHSIAWECIIADFVILFVFCFLVLNSLHYGNHILK